ncbi:enoyl-CoA hydratase/isomerase family protein [Bordetella pertussis]|uniref:enoyl-CoA hydratase/isomerase family protein n=1 Tax=Bordetella pertussis TaxID=520 RepID=UPI00366FE21A
MNHISIRYEDSVAVVTYDRGEKKNAMSMQIIRDLTATAEALKDRHDITCVVLGGSRAAFSAGVDLTDPERFDLAGKSLSEQRQILTLGTRMCRAWEELPQITVAAIEGMNVGGGVALTLCCDWRVMADDAYLFVPEAQIGINLSWNAIPRLVNMVGASMAKQIVLLGEKMPSAQARELGLVDWVVPGGSAEARAIEVAGRVSQCPAHVVRMSKQSINAHANALNHLGTYMDVDQAMVCGASPEAVRARDQFNKARA